MSLFHKLNPAIVPTSPREKLRASLGALTGILATGLVSTIALQSDASVPLLVAPMGASAVLLFAAPASPLAQPWSILGGNLIAAVIGVTCAKFLGAPLLAAAIAVSAAIAIMLMLNCLHPPSGAVALTAVLGGPAIQKAGYWFVLSPIALNSVILLVIALLFNNVTGRRYPHATPGSQPSRQGTADPAPSHRIGVVASDIEAVIQEQDEFIDVSPEDLDLLFHRAQIRAFERQTSAVTCSDIMSRDVIFATTGQSLKAVWRIFMTRHVKALPVVDANGKLTGIVGLEDFLENSVLSSDGSLKLGLGHRMLALFSKRQLPTRVDEIMQTRVQSAIPETRITSLVSPMVDQGLDQMPVVDADNRLVGIVSQSDLLAALFQSELDQMAITRRR
ncbi:HPP family protein [Rhizobium lemnae]|uniref:HPP family protein n=1 Tax=Rhizobium lemnae TaxID=1214924 RepID=A0ABV8EBG8_9HYPH|nr:HPP family protein [Rhizobium lemnae]MCJ8507404.1 HPP family protein [Rhizobium lemnae]